jgi:serine protein kinase
MSKSAEERLLDLAREVKTSFDQQRRVLSFDQYLSEAMARPRVLCRDAARYVKDMLEFYGQERVVGVRGEEQRYRLFDLSFLPAGEGESDGLVGHETVQGELVRALGNFVRVGAPNRVILLHGPNGSAKSTTAGCLLRVLEHYSNQDEGAVYRYDWVFPKKRTVRGAIGFGGRSAAPTLESYAHLPDEELDARVRIEVRDHPLFLLPHEARRRLLVDLLGSESEVPRWLLTGSLCDKSQKIFQALLGSYEGALEEVLRHVRVERVLFSRRYRVGAVTLGPELSVDARERQLTMDQNMAALPVSLQGLSLFEATGELVDASGGILELSDLLKRPLDAFKYLQITAETGEVALGSQNLLVNSVLLASGNDLHLAAFREHPEYASFRGRLDLIRVGYLLDHRLEKKIYDRQVAARVGTHVAPHAMDLAARFAVLTRLEKPDPDRHEQKDRDIVRQLTAWQKLELYAGGNPELGGRSSEVSMAQLKERLAREWDSSEAYEGGDGVSPRTLRTLLLDAAQHPQFGYLSPFAVLSELGEFVAKKSDYSFLKRSIEGGGYHDHDAFLKKLRGWLLDRLEEDFSRASGLVEEQSYEDLLGRYIEHVSASVKGEKIKSSVTGRSEAADEAFMAEVEGMLAFDATSGLGGSAGRPTLLGRIAAWALDHPGERVRDSDLFRDLLQRLRRSVFQERQAGVARFCQQLVDPEIPREAADEKRIEQAFIWLEQNAGYRQDSARDAAARLVAERYQKAPERGTR